MPITFPTTALPPVRVNPRILVLYGRPKIRKTMTVAAIPDSLLLVTDPDGGDYLTVRRYDIRAAMREEKFTGTRLEFLRKQVIPALKAQRPAKRLIIDTWDEIEDWVLQEINTRRQNLLIAERIDTVIELKMGLGQEMILRQLSELWLDFETCADELVFVIHSRDMADRGMDQSNTEKLNTVREAASGDLDLRGKNRKMPVKLASAVGKLTKQSPDLFTDNLLVSFRPNADTASGNRLLRLENTEFLLSQCIYARGTDGKRIIDPVSHEPKVEKFETHWDRIYI